MFCRIRVAAAVLSFHLLADTLSAQFGEMKIAHGERFVAGTVTLTRPAETTLGYLPAGTYEVEIEYRYLRRVIAVFRQAGRPIAESYGYLKGFPEAMHRENSALAQSAASVMWKDLGFGVEGSIEIAPAGDRDVVTIHPGHPASERGSIIIRLEPVHAAIGTAGGFPFVGPNWTGAPDRPHDPMDDSL